MTVRDDGGVAAGAEDALSVLEIVAVTDHAAGYFLAHTAAEYHCDVPCAPLTPTAFRVWLQSARSPHPPSTAAHAVAGAVPPADGSPEVDGVGGRKLNWFHRPWTLGYGYPVTYSTYGYPYGGAFYGVGYGVGYVV